MRQVSHKLRDGKVRVVEVPPPMVLPGTVLVRTHYSVVSPGTEGRTLRTGRKSLLGKARERPEQVRQVLEVLGRSGPLPTYRAVLRRLEAYSPLGYSCAGDVVDVGPDVRDFQPGDLVACGGVGHANHAEYNVVPTNLCVRLPEGADLQKAAYNALGAIALQGLRQADARLGETCVVIGLGLIGHLTCLLLRASGVRVVGIDLDARAVELAARHCADLALTRDRPDLEERCREFTSGIGADAVIITAASQSTDPVELAGILLRKRGRVVVVGDVPTGFSREHYYRKELELRMSCSYGPGRYDPTYEEKGTDYPPAYVRWTEKRNMQAFQELIHSGRVDVGYLTTHRFPLDRAQEAFDLVLGRREPCLGILIEFGVEPPRRQPEPRVSGRSPGPRSRVNAGFIGAGSYSMTHLMPAVRSEPAVRMRGVLSAHGTSAVSAAEWYGFDFCTSKEAEILENPEIDTVFIATRHDSHAHYVLRALRAGKNVFVEKPLCLTLDDLDAIERAYRESGVPGGRNRLMVGFNRRFAPLTRHVKERLGHGPMAMVCRVNAGTVPPDSWIQDPAVGGGRIVGEACHFVDLMVHLCGSLPTRVFATAMADPDGTADTVTISLRFADGSVGTMAYLANGSRALPKEYIEVHRAGMSAVIRDFREVEILGDGRSFRRRLIVQDKGQRHMVRQFVGAIVRGEPAPIPFEELAGSTRATLMAVESLRLGRAVDL